MSITEARGKEFTDQDEIEIRLDEITKFLRDSRRKVVLSTIISLLIGLFYAFSLPDVYTSYVSVMPESQISNESLGSIGSLVGLAGININSNSSNINTIRPEIYPDILQSIPCALHLLRQPIHSDLLKKKTNLQTFLEEENTQSLLSKITRFKSLAINEAADSIIQSEPIVLNTRQEWLVKRINNAIVASFDRRTGIIKVSANLSDAKAVADLAHLSLEYLTNYIISYRTDKAKSQVRFLMEQVADARQKYQAAELELSSYKDKNRNIFLNTAKLQEQRLQSDFLLTQSIFNELSKQLEQAKIKEAEQAPVFKILEPPTVPLHKSGPRRSLIIVSFIIAGAFIGVFFQLLTRLRSRKNLK